MKGWDSPVSYHWLPLGWIIFKTEQFEHLCISEVNFVHFNTLQYSLGNYPEQLFVEQKPLELMDDFRRKLEVLSYDIKARNVGLPLPYTYLDPENIENSIAI